MSIEDNKKLVAAFWVAVSKLDFDTALPMTAEEDFTWWLGGEPEKFPMAGLRTKEQFLALFKEILKIAPGGIQVKPIAWTAEGDRVAMEAESSAKTISGKVYHNKYHFLHIVRDGKIQSVREYLDTMHTNDVFCA